MGFENASILWTSQDVSMMAKSSRLRFDNVIQRGLVWETQRKSRLIESLIISVPIPAIYAKRYDAAGSKKKGSYIYDILDGKQRLTAIIQYLDNKYALCQLPPVTFFDYGTGEDETADISGKVFSELPRGIQNIIMGAKINVIYFDNLTVSEERELFKRLNSGKALTAKNIVLANCKDIEGFLDIGSHKLFGLKADNGMMSANSLEKKSQVALVMKCWCMLYMDINEISFETNALNQLMEEKVISDVDKVNMVQIFNFAFDTHARLAELNEKAVARKMYVETNMVSLLPFFKKAFYDGVSVELMAEWILAFFGTKDKSKSNSDDYNRSIDMGGTAKTSSIKMRHNALMDSYIEFFKPDQG